jgi:hypothetical protein
MAVKERLWVMFGQAVGEFIEVIALNGHGEVWSAGCDLMMFMMDMAFGPARNGNKVGR